MKATHSETVEFLLKEYDNARVRINADIDEINKSEVFFSTLIGAIYWFLFFMKPQSHFFIIIYLMIPVIVSIFSMLRYTAHRHTIKTHEAYIKEHIEHFFLIWQVHPPGLAFFYDQRSPKYLKPVRYTFHFLLISLTVGFLCYSLFYPDVVSNLLKASS